MVGLLQSARSDKLNIFISYSRDDLAFADQLAAGLEVGGFAFTIDRHGISGGEDWKRRLGSLILDADTVAFVLSPSSARSDICAWEVVEAVRLGKRIIPVVCRPLDGASAPPQLADLNYIFFYGEPKSPGSGFGTGLSRLVTALNTDLDWLREHTRLLQRASEWEAGGRPANRLLSGPDIAAAKDWAARRPKEAPEPTPQHLDFIKASEVAETARADEARQQLATIAAAQEERARALTDKEEAQNARDIATRQTVRRTRAGAAVAALLSGIVAVAGWNAHLGKLELGAANQRLSTEMKLRIAPFGKEAYTIPEQWYKLATTNASSVAFFEFQDGGEWLFVATGFVIKGRELFAPWGEKDVFVAAGHAALQARKQNKRIVFPALAGSPPVLLGQEIWSTYGDGVNIESVDITVFQIAEALPRGVRVIDRVAEADVSKWPPVEFVASKRGVEVAALTSPLPMIILGASVADYDPHLRPALTLSLANALGRDGRLRVQKAIFTDSTTRGSSGSPVFDASDGRLFAIVQYGPTERKEGDKGLSYAGGVVLSALRQAISEDAEHGIERGRELLSQKKESDAESLFALALARNPAAGREIDAAWAAVYVERGIKLLEPEWLETKTSFEGREANAQALFALALARNPAVAKKIDEAWALAHVERGKWWLIKQSKNEEAKARFDLALARNPGLSGEVALAYIERGHRLLEEKNDAEAAAIFAVALQNDATKTGNIDKAWADAYIERASQQIEEGDDTLAAAQFELARKRGVQTMKLAEAEAGARFRRGERLADGGKDAEAEVQFDLALAKDPELSPSIKWAWTRVFHDRAWTLYKAVLLENQPKELFGQALAAANRADELSPDDQYLRVRRALILVAMGNIDAACNDIEKSQLSGWELASFALGRCHEARGNHEAAVASYRHAVKAHTERAKDKALYEYIAGEAWQRLAALGVAQPADQPVGGSR